jgi:DNA-binding LacI/PurR family transcriptional regulator
MPVTLKDIAEKAGVSKPVVSAVLNNRSKNSRVGKATRKRILDLAKELHYIPNTAAQSLTTKETKCVHVVLPSFKFFEVEHNAHMVSSLQAYLYERGYKLQVTSLQYALQDDRLIETINADGIVYFYWGAKGELVEQMQKLEVPVIVVNAKYDAGNASNVYLDEGAGLYDLFKKIVAAGHKDITFVGTYMGDLVHQSGLAGLQRAVKESPGVNFKYIRLREDVGHITTLDRVQSLARRGLEQALAAEPKPTVVMYNSDVQAMAGVKNALDMGYKVPDDISITGTGDLMLAASCATLLTTTENKSMEMGEIMGEMILDKIVNRNDEIQQIGVKPKAIIRESLSQLK